MHLGSEKMKLILFITLLVLILALPQANANVCCAYTNDVNCTGDVWCVSGNSCGSLRKCADTCSSCCSADSDCPTCGSGDCAGNFKCDISSGRCQNTCNSEGNSCTLSKTCNPYCSGKKYCTYPANPATCSGTCSSSGACQCTPDCGSATCSCIAAECNAECSAGDTTSCSYCSSESCPAGGTKFCTGTKSCQSDCSWGSCSGVTCSCVSGTCGVPVCVDKTNSWSGRTACCPSDKCVDYDGACVGNGQWGNANNANPRDYCDAGTWKLGVCVYTKPSSTCAEYYTTPLSGECDQYLAECVGSCNTGCTGLVSTFYSLDVCDRSSCTGSTVGYWCGYGANCGWKYYTCPSYTTGCDAKDGLCYCESDSWCSSNAGASRPKCINQEIKASCSSGGCSESSQCTVAKSFCGCLYDSDCPSKDNIKGKCDSPSGTGHVSGSYTYTCVWPPCSKNDECVDNSCCTADPTLPAECKDISGVCVNQGNLRCNNKYLCDPPEWHVDTQTKTQNIFEVILDFFSHFFQR